MPVLVQMNLLSDLKCFNWVFGSVEVWQFLQFYHSIFQRVIPQGQMEQ